MPCPPPVDRQAQITFFVLPLGYGNGLEHLGGSVETLRSSCLGEPWVHHHPLGVLAAGTDLEVLGDVAWYARREGVSPTYNTPEPASQQLKPRARVRDKKVGFA